MAQTDIVNLIDTGSLSEVAVKSRQNKEEAVAAKALSAGIDSGAAADVAKIEANADIQKSADLAEIGLRKVINDETIKLNDNVKGVRNTLEAFSDNYERVLADYEQVAADSEGFSFFTNPIATIRNHVVMAQQKEQLNTLTEAMNSGNAHIDDEYARAAQKISDYKATVMNV